MKKLKLVPLIFGALFFVGTLGEILCVYRALSCNWEPVGKAEIVYSVGACTGLGAVIGFIHIKDN